MWNRFVVICQDGSREEVIAESYDEEFAFGVGPVLVFKPDARYSDDQQGKFYAPQGIHRIEKDVEMPDAGTSPDEEDESDD